MPRLFLFIFLCYSNHGDNMSYLKKLFFSLKEVLITYILSYFLIIISGLIYSFLGYEDLTFFINTICPYLLIVYYLITIIYLYQKNYYYEPVLPLKQYPTLIYLGLSIATFFNMLIFKINPPTSSNSLSLFLLFITSGLIGPIYEEITFRYIFLKKLKKFNSKKKAIILNSAIFALIHLDPIKIIYAFILGLTLNLSYEQNNNILAPILIHIFANTIVLFLTEYNPIILLLSLILFFISLKINHSKQSLFKL